MSTPSSFNISTITNLLARLDEHGLSQQNLDILLNRGLLDDLLKAFQNDKQLNRFRICQALSPDGSLLPFKIVHYGPMGKQMEVTLGSAEDELLKLIEAGVSFWEQDVWSKPAIIKQWKKVPRVFGKFLIIEFPIPRIFSGIGTQHPCESREILESYDMVGATVIELMGFAQNLIHLFGQEKTQTQVVSLAAEFPPLEGSRDSETMFARITFGGKHSPEMGLSNGRYIGTFSANGENNRYLYLVKVND